MSAVPTLLTTRRMEPELAARVRASVRGRRGTRAFSQGLLSRATAVGLARLGGVLALAAVIVGLGVRDRRQTSELEQARRTLVAEVMEVSAPLDSADLAAEGRMEAWLRRSSLAYEGDFIADSLRAPRGLDAALAAPAVYVRGTAELLATATGVVQAASASMKDPLLACLLSPPGGRTEGALLAKVHRAYAGDVDPPVAAVRRLRDVQLGLPFLTPDWISTIKGATTREDLDPLRRAFEKAPVAAASMGLRARLLIFAVDEPGDATGPTELDGERPHPVRVELVDLASSKVLLRVRKEVNPAVFSAERRPLYANGLDSCALAYDVRATVSAKL